MGHNIRCWGHNVTESQIEYSRNQDTLAHFATKSDTRAWEVVIAFLTDGNNIAPYCTLTSPDFTHKDLRVGQDHTDCRQ